jgi:hypothetical protein
MEEDSLPNDEESYDFPPNMSQDTCARFRKIQFYVETNFPERLNEYQSLLRRAITNNKDPATLAKRVRRWDFFSV